MRRFYNLRLFYMSECRKARRDSHFKEIIIELTY